MAEKVVSQVTFEVEQIDRLLAAYAALRERAQQRGPDLVEITALASVLHSLLHRPGEHSKRELEEFLGSLQHKGQAVD